MTKSKVSAARLCITDFRMVCARRFSKRANRIEPERPIGVFPSGTGDLLSLTAPAHPTLTQIPIMKGLKEKLENR